MYVYVYRNKVNGKRYVGQTVKSVSRRWIEHRSHALKNRFKCYFHRAIRKYGVEAFVLECVVIVSSKVDMDFYEQGLIKLYDCKAPKGYNLTDGGEGCVGYVHDANTCRKMSVAHTGVPLSEEHRKNLALSLIKTHCKRDHELSGDNVYIRPDKGTKVCRICMKRRERQRKRRHVQ